MGARHADAGDHMIDGKTRISTQTGKDGQGQTVNNTTFYEKQ